MKTRTAGIMLLLWLCLPVLWAQPGGTGARDAAARIDARYNVMRSLRADFTENYSGGGIERSESGTLWLKKPGKMRWDYVSPRKKIFLIDGATAWFYVPGERQARRTTVKKVEDLRSPLRYLLGRTRLEKELRGLSLAVDVAPEKPGDVVLRGVPVGMEDRISEVLLESDGQGYLRRIVMNELDGSRTEFRLEQQQENVAIPDTEFRFQPPAGVEVLQSDQLEP
jgi:outer membrane lipoprotein carrier protein